MFQQVIDEFPGTKHHRSGHGDDQYVKQDDENFHDISP